MPLAREGVTPFSGLIPFVRLHPDGKCRVMNSQEEGVKLERRRPAAV
jgi:hypothetical protein